MKLNRFSEVFILTGFVLFIILSAYSIISWHKYIEKEFLPDYDGNRHIAISANTAYAIKHMNVSALDLDKNIINLFSYIVLAVIFLAGAYGQIAFASVYILCLLIVAFAFHFRFKKKHTASVLGMLLFLFTGLYFSPKGGVFDLRLDIISVSVSILSLSYFRKGKYNNGFLFMFIAALFKGAAFFLLAPFSFFLVFAELWNHFKTRSLKAFLKSQFSMSKIWRYFPAVSLGYLFFRMSLLSSLSYNLMGAGGNTLSDRIFSFFSSIVLSLTSFDYYIKVIFSENVTSILVFAIGCALYLFQIFNKKLYQKEYFQIFLFGFYTYLLLSINPLHSSVLKIWFAPAFFLLTAENTHSFFNLIGRFHFKNLTPVALFVFLLTCNASLILSNSIRENPDAVRKNTRLKTQFLSDKTAEFFKLNFEVSSKVLILGNFASAQFRLPNYTDTFRAALQSSLGNYDYYIEADEFISFKTDIWYEVFMKHLENYSKVIVFLQENPGGIPGHHPVLAIGKGIFEEFFQWRKYHPECFRLVAEAELPETGKGEILFLISDKKCNSLFRRQHLIEYEQDSIK